MNNMKKFLGVTLAVLTLSAAAACSKAPAEETTAAEEPGVTGSAADETAVSENAAEGVDLKALKDNMISSLGIENAADVAADRLTALYGIEAADVTDSACFITMQGVFPEEIVMVKAADDAAAARIAEKLLVRLQDVLNQSKNYDEENYALAQTCKVMSKNGYVALFISAQHEAMEKMFDEAV